MNAYTTETGSEQTLSPLSRRRQNLRAGRFFTQTQLHARAILRLARRRPAIALGLAVGVGATVSAAGAVASVSALHGLQRMELAIGVAPLAPAPAPPAPPPAPPVELTQQHHHHALHLPGNPLRGFASWYGSLWNGRTTASGETFDETKLTAAHKTLPLGTLVRVTNLSSQRSVVVRINDRGTLAPNRVIDLSSAAAHEIGLLDQGLARVKLEILGRI